MFISVIYKETPELDVHRLSSEIDLSAERTLLVNPECHVRVMLEYIRKKCRLGIYNIFDLCDERGGLMGLFSMPYFAYAHDKFEHKKTYYIIVLKTEADKSITVLPQLNHENPLYETLKVKVKQYLVTGHLSPLSSTPATLLSAKTPPIRKKK